MNREFSIVEIMLEGCSGQVDGVVHANEWTGEVESVECHSYDFFDDDNDHAVVLDSAQRHDVERIVRQTLELDSELTGSHELLVVSAGNVIVSATELSPAQKILAEYLESVRPAAPPASTPVAREPRQRRFGS